MKRYNSQQILQAEDLYELQDSFCGSGSPFEYELTDEEIAWLHLIRGKYSIADWINTNMHNGVLTFTSSEEMSEALDNDCKDAGKAIMLSDDTALQKLFFWLYTESPY